MVLHVALLICPSIVVGMGSVSLSLFTALRVHYQNGTICLAVYFEALVAIIYIEHGIDAARKFLQTISFFENVKKIV